MNDKICNKCQKTKSLEDFRLSKTGKYGRHAYCENCHSLDSEERYQKNKLKRIKQAAAWNDENKDKTKEYKKKYYQSTKNPLENL